MNRIDFSSFKWKEIISEISKTKNTEFEYLNKPFCKKLLTEIRKFLDLQLKTELI